MKENWNAELVPFEDNEFRIYMRLFNEAVTIRHNLRNNNSFHEQVEIKYFYEGNANLFVGDEVINVSSGDIVVVNPYEFHSTITTDGGRYHLLILDLDFLDMRGAAGVDLKSIFMQKRIFFKHLISNDERIRNIIEAVIDELTAREENYKTVIKCLFSEFFIILMRNYIERSNTNVRIEEKIRYYNWIEPAINKIMIGYAKNISLQEMAELCNMSKHHFCRVFKSGTGMAPLEYLTEFRLKNSDVLLAATDMSIAEIALECGFGDAAYFSRCYKKNRGISPRESRRILSEKQ